MRVWQSNVYKVLFADDVLHVLQAEERRHEINYGLCLLRQENPHAQDGFIRPTGIHPAGDIG